MVRLNCSLCLCSFDLPKVWKRLCLSLLVLRSSTRHFPSQSFGTANIGGRALLPGDRRHHDCNRQVHGYARETLFHLKFRNSNSISKLPVVSVVIVLIFSPAEENNFSSRNLDQNKELSKIESRTLQLLQVQRNCIDLVASAKFALAVCACIHLCLRGFYSKPTKNSTLKQWGEICWFVIQVADKQLWFLARFAAISLTEVFATMLDN